MANSTRTIRVVIDATQARAGAAQVNAALGSIGPSAQRAQGALNQANMSMVGMGRGTAGMSQSLAAANSNITRTSGGILGMAKSLGRATIAVAGLVAITGGLTLLVTALTTAGDAASMMEARLRIVTKSSLEYAAANATVHRIANETRSDITALTNLYSKMAMNSRNLGIETSQIGVATRTFAMSLKVSGASAQEAASSILQLGQAMASGRLSGDEFRSLAENSPVFMNLLADSMGVPLGALRKLGMEGKLTGQQIAKALTDPALIAKIESEFGRIPVTFADVRTGIGNTLIDIAGALKKGLGIDQSLAVMLAGIQKFAADSLPFFIRLGQQIRGTFASLAPIFKAAFAVVGGAISFVAQNMQTLTRIALAVGAGFLVMKASMGLSSIIAQVVGLGTSMGVTGGISAFFAGAIRMATSATNTFTAALLANPLTAIATALTIGIALLVQFSDKIKIGTGEFGTLADAGAEVLSMIGPMLKWLGDTAKSVFSAIGGFFRTYFGPIADFAARVFGDVDFSLMGFAKIAASVIDFVAGGFIGGFYAIKAVWGLLPQALGAIVTSAANFVISGIEGMINRAIDGINRLISMANNIPMVNIGALGNVAMGRINGPAMPDIGGAIAGGMARGRGGIGVRDAVDAFGNRVEERGRRRVAGQGEGADNPITSTNNTANNTGNPLGDDGKASKEAEKLAEAMNDFWQGLEASRDAAGLMGIELERHNAILEYRKILGDGDLSRARQLTAEETARINLLLTETATRKALADLEQSGLDHARQRQLLEDRRALLGTMSLEQANDEIAIRERMGGLTAKFLEEGVDLNSEAVRQALAREEAALRENAALERGNRLLDERVSKGNALLERYARQADPRGAAVFDRNERDASIRSATRREGESDADFQRRVTVALEGSAREFANDLTDISGRFYDELSGAISQIGRQIGGEWGEAISILGEAIAAMSAAASGDFSQSGILGGIARLFSGTKENPTAFGNGVREGASGFMEQWSTAFSKPMESLSSSFSNFSQIFKSGNFMKSLGSVLGSAMQGANVGAGIAPLGKMLWKQFNETGSQIGGAIGGMIGGPIGSIIGSIGGGIIGGLIGGRKVASGKGLITLDKATGTLTVSSSGKHGGEADAASMADKVVSGITSIAQRLGATFGGNPIVAVGKNGGDWRVSPTGGGVTGKEGINFKTEAEAIAFAIKDLIADGILVGISSFSERLLRNAKNLDAAVGLAEQYEKLLKELGSMKDPVGFAVTELTKNLNRLVDMMTKSGATADELAKVAEYRTLKLDEMLKDQLSSLIDFKRDLSGDGSGVTALNRLTSAQDEFAKMQADILAGKTVDQEKFTRIGQEIFGLARSVFGTSSSQFQAIREALMAATDGAIANVTDSFNDATVVAINQQTDAITQNQTIQNDLLRQMLERMGGGSVDGWVGGGSSVNGRYVGSSV